MNHQHAQSYDKPALEKEAPAPKENKINREQRRRMEKINQEAKAQFNAYCQRFTDFVLNAEDPEGAEVAEKRKVINGQWKLYCYRKNLINEAYEQFDKYADNLLDEYKIAKEDKPEENEQKVEAERIEATPEVAQG